MTEKQEKKELLNIYQRMNRVMAEVKYIRKKDKAAKGLPYTYVTHDAVTGALHEPFVKHGIVTTTQVLKKAKDGNRTEVEVLVSFINIDNPEDRVEVESFGYGIDSQDKGPGKAISYATKMAYLKCFMLETGEDPEKDNEDHKPELITEEQILELESMFALIDPSIKSKVLKWKKQSKLEDLTKEQYKEVRDAVKTKINQNKGE